MLLALCVGLSGCLYQDLEVLAVEDFSEVSLSSDGLKARMELDVFNPNPYAVNVVVADVQLYVGDEVVGDVVLPEGLSIRPDARATVPLEVKTRDGALGKVLKNDLMNLLLGAEVTFQTRGSVKAKALGLTFSIPVRHQQSLTLRP